MKQYDTDCALSSYCELTGQTYEQADAVMRSVGFRPGEGTPEEGILPALSVNGYGTRCVSYRVEDLPRYSLNGHRFLVIGWTEDYKHAWTVINGKRNRPFDGTFRYRVYEVFG